MRAARFASALLIALCATVADAARVSISALLGVRVDSPEGERLGTMRDLVIDLGAGEVAYAILDLRDPSFDNGRLRFPPGEATAILALEGAPK